MNINYKLIASEQTKPGVVFNDRSVESHMANKGKKQLADANRGINQTYYECGKNHSNRTAILFLCSGEGTRAVIASDKRKAITEATVHHRTPLELLFESTPPDIGKIIVSIQKNDTLITNYLGKNNYFDRQQTPNNMSVITIDQPEVKTNRETNYPGGAGLIIEELLKDTWSRLLQDSCIDQLIIMDGEKLGYNTDELYQFIGFHVHHKNQLSVATYAPLPDPDKKFAHIDTINNQAYAGKKTPESLEKRSENHHLSGGVYLLDLSQRKNLKQLDATSEKKGKGDETFTYKETPPISLIEAANGQIGYYQHTRGELGRGIKDRKAFTANIREDSKKASLFLQDKGWIILPDMGIELANVQLNAVQPDNRVNLNSTLFLAGDLVIGENNEYYEGNIITAAKKEITIGRDNVFKKINLAGSIKLGDKNEIAGSTFLADVPAKYLDFIPLSKTTVLKNLTDLEKKLCNSQYKTTEKTIQIGNNCELNDCTLIGSFIIGDDVVLDSSLLVNYSEKPMIIPSKSVIKGTNIENKQIWDINNTTDKPIKIKNSVIADTANSNNSIKAGSECAGEDTEIENFSLTFCNFAHYYLPEKLIPPDERQPKKLQIIVETLLNKKIKLWKNSENNRPGLFIIRENEKDYKQLVDHLYSHAADLLDCVALNGEETEELRHYLHSFINIRINEPNLGVLVIDLLTMQEAKNVLNELVLRFYQKKMTTIANPYQHAAKIIAEQEVKRKKIPAVEITKKIKRVPLEEKEELVKANATPQSPTNSPKVTSPTITKPPPNQPQKIVGMLGLSLTDIIQKITFPGNYVTDLDLSDEGLGDTEIQALAEALKHRNCRLIDLILSKNKITNFGVKFLAEAIKHPNCRLTDLSLNNNEDIGDAGLQALVKAKRHRTGFLWHKKVTLERLGLDNHLQWSIIKYY